MFRTTIIFLILPALAAWPLWAQLQIGVIRGKVTGQDGTPLEGALVNLRDPRGSLLVSTQSGVNGEFVLTGIAPGSYMLAAATSQLRSLSHPIAVRSALPTEVELWLRAPIADELVVTSSGEVSLAATRISLAGEAVRSAPERLRSRGIQAAVATAPGWATEDNGIVHVRGVDDGFLYVIDGVPVYDRLDNIFGFSPDSSTVSSVHVLTGYIPPEFGLKSGGVIEVRSELPPFKSWRGTVELGAGSLGTREASGVALGPISKNVALAVNLSGEESRRFLDPVHPMNFHNRGNIAGGGTQLSWSPTGRDSVNVGIGFGRSEHQVPHVEAQEGAGQDQRQRLDANFQSLSWQRFWSNRTVSQIAGYARATTAKVLGSAADTPLVVRADRNQRRMGFLASVTHHRQAHTLKAGMEASRLSLREFFSFAVTDEQEGKESGLSPKALVFTQNNPFAFRGSARRPLWSFYLQDSFAVHKNLALDVGVRFDHSGILVSESQWSPRIGVSWRLPARHTVLRASANRFFQPPQPENLLLASSREARALSPFATDQREGGADLRAERQTAFEVGVEQSLGKVVRLDIAYWRRRVRNFADPNVLFGTTVIFPNSVARGRAAGVDVHVEVTPQKGWSGYLSYSNGHVVQFGPINGGLFLEQNFPEIGPGTRFTPDHDQRNVAAVGVTREHEPSGVWFSFTGRYESGTPLELEEEERRQIVERPGANLVNIERGRVKPRAIFNAMAGKRVIRSDHLEVTARLEVLNLANKAYVFNFGNPFSGTHFGSPRTVALRLSFHVR